VTSRIRLGTGVCLVAQRDPIVTAKEVASLDRISGGRFLFGVGAGWNVEEMRNHGTDPRRRFGLMRERIEAMKAIWGSDEATYAGEHVRFDRIWSWPKPLQQPHPPILVGGNGPGVLDRVLAFGDEWMPNRVKDDELIERVGQLTARAQQAGRPSVPVTVMGVMRDPARIERLERAGVHRVAFWVPSVAAEIEATMDRFAAIAQEYERAGG
jgi:probable F420-dependent oxidoreductase